MFPKKILSKHFESDEHFLAILAKVKISKNILTLSQNNMLKCLIEMLYLRGYFRYLVENGGVNN